MPTGRPAPRHACGPCWRPLCRASCATTSSRPSRAAGDSAGNFEHVCTSEWLGLAAWPKPTVPAGCDPNLTLTYSRLGRCCRSIYDIMTAAKPPEVEDRLPLAMKPCTELLPAAVMVADITGFTARELAGPCPWQAVRAALAC